MKVSEVTVKWKGGIHARPASKLVLVAREFRSSIMLKCNDQMASARSILGILLLCATMGATIQVEVDGEDEDLAIQAVQRAFETPE